MKPKTFITPVAQLWPIDRLIPYARNPRTNDHAVDRMCAAITEFGFRIPVVARSDGTVVDGHLRLKAAQRLGLTEVPVVCADDLTDAQIKAFRLLANRSATWAIWDDELLALELKDLREVGFDLDLTGFDAGELRGLLEEAPKEGLTDEDALPAVAEPVTKPGDLWQLGEHRLLCGDATNPDDVRRLWRDGRPNLLVSDPPYGVAYNPATRKSGETASGLRMGKVLNDDRADWREAWALFPGDVCYVFHAALRTPIVAESLIASGFDLRAQIVWTKPHFALSRGDFHWQHEPCWYAVRAGAKSNWQGARNQSTVWAVSPVKGEDEATIHGTQKPVELMRRAIVNNSAPGDLVYEPFAGVGQHHNCRRDSGRACRAIELDPSYCDVVVKRWSSFLGTEPYRCGALGGTDASK